MIFIIRVDILVYWGEYKIPRRNKIREYDLLVYDIAGCMSSTFGDASDRPLTE